MGDIQRMLNKPYKWGFSSDIPADTIPRGLSEDTVRLISAKKDEPPWMLDFRLRAYRTWLTMTPPAWSDNTFPQIDYQAYFYYSEPKTSAKKASLDEVDPALLATFDKLGIPLMEQKRLSNVAVDAVFDSVSIGTTFRKELKAAGVIFCSFSEAVKEYPELVQKYMGSVVPVADNYFAALNSAVFSDGSFVYVPKGVVSPMELSTYFRINATETGQFERTLIIVEDDGYVSYLEGCTAPSYDKNQLHAAVVELHAGARAEIKYSTVQNWYAGDAAGVGGIYNFVTKRGLCAGERAKISWTQVETGSAITWKARRAPVLCCSVLFWHVLTNTRSTVPVGGAGGRPQRGGILFGRPHQQRAAGGHGHQDGARGETHPQPHREQGHLGGVFAQRVPGAGVHVAGRDARAQHLPVRLHAAGRPRGGAHLPVHHGAGAERAGGARGKHVQDR